MNTKTKKYVTLAMLCAVAYVVMLVGRIPIVMFLSYDPKDVIIAISGFIFGPLSVVFISTVVSVIEMVTVSSTGPIGCIMNIISTCAFACTAAIIYKKKHTMSGAVMGLIAGTIAMTGIMLLWNYFLTPIYEGLPRQAIADMLVPIFLPFNLLKAGLNTAITLLLYKPIVMALRKTKLLPPSEDNTKKKNRIGLLLVSLLLLASCVLLVLIWKGII
ncbi:MAG: ECF transporter S component [Oscillospiraceae bacterium]